MPTSYRQRHKSSMLDHNSWYISGGHGVGGGVNSLSSTEYWAGDFGADLPNVLYGHCQLTLDSSHVLILAGSDGNNNQNAFYMLDLNKRPVFVSYTDSEFSDVVL